MKIFDNPKKKTFCYKDDCNIVITGAQYNFYPVCTICKEDVTQEIADRFDSKKIKLLGVGSWEEELLLALKKLNKYTP